MELSNPLFLVFIVFLVLFLFAWFVLRRVAALVNAKEQDSAIMLMQQQIDQFRLQIGQLVDNNAKMMQQQLGQMLGHVNDRLKENAAVLGQTQINLAERLDNAARVVGQVQRSLGGLEESNRKIYEVGKDIASLSEILRAPKLRGGIGEFFLQDLLTQILPSGHFTMQHGFRSGEKVDAVIKLGDALVPVDSKFPLENFRRLVEAASDDGRARLRRQFANDVKRHIDSIAAKYILPDEGTYDFALMYIPAENVYYETIIKDEVSQNAGLVEYAMARRVIPVSPNSFYAFLQTVVLGLRGLKIEEQAKEILQNLARLQGDFAKFKDEFSLVGRHLVHVQASYQNADKRLDQFGQKLQSITTDPTECSDPIKPLDESR